MVVITGAPRTGTSMMMQTLKILNFPIVGNKFNEHDLEEFNPKGYYNLPVEEFVKGVKDDRYQGKAIKLMGDGMLNSNDRVIKKLIICTRNQPDSIRSFHKVLQGNKLGIDDSIETAALVVRSNIEIAKLYSQVFEGEVFKVPFTKMIDKPEKVIKDLCKYLDINPSKYRIKKAIKNIERG